MYRATKAGRLVGVGAAIMIVLLWLPLSSSAAKVDSAISQGFSSQDDLAVGSLVSLTEETSTGTVQAANTDNSERLIGVTSKLSLIELSGGAHGLQVAIGGSSFALVSDINGEVKRGDKIAPSPLSGIGMKATESSQVVGTAEQDFADAKQVSTQQVKDKSGVEHSVKVGLINTQINVAYYQKPDDNKSILPSFILKFANAVAGRQVAPVRVIIAIILLAAGFGGVAVLLYASVRSSIISIGRNPLSADAVHKGLFEIAALAIGILMLTLIALYLVLVI
jgi:hypothetical protein